MSRINFLESILLSQMQELEKIADEFISHIEDYQNKILLKKQSINVN